MWLEMVQKRKQQNFVSFILNNSLTIHNAPIFVPLFFGLQSMFLCIGEESNCIQLETAQSNNIKRGVESVLMEPVAFPGIGIELCSTEVIE